MVLLVSVVWKIFSKSFIFFFWKTRMGKTLCTECGIRKQQTHMQENQKNYKPKKKALNETMLPMR